MAAVMIGITGSFRSDKRALNSRIMGLCFLASFDRLTILTEGCCQRITAAKYTAKDYDPTTGNLASKAGVGYTYLAQSGTCPDGALGKARRWWRGSD